MVASGVLFTVQEKYIVSPTIYNVLRTIRMGVIYGAIPIWFSRKYGGSPCDLGLCLPKSKGNFGISLFGGLMIYQIAAIVFLAKKIFFNGWLAFTSEEVVINLVLIGIMASLTDFWTRGFILMQFSDHYGKRWGIIIQNMSWFTIHIYEVQLLQYYMGLWGAIALTLILGIGGDLVALKTRNLYGLMLGHFVLNIQIAMAARGLLVSYTILI